jgi:hypothetical protein
MSKSCGPASAQRLCGCRPRGAPAHRPRASRRWSRRRPRAARASGTPPAPRRPAGWRGDRPSSAPPAGGREHGGGNRQAADRSAPPAPRRFPPRDRSPASASATARREPGRAHRRSRAGAARHAWQRRPHRPGRASVSTSARARARAPLRQMETPQRRGRFQAGRARSRGALRPGPPHSARRGRLPVRGSLRKPHRAAEPTARRSDRAAAIRFPEAQGALVTSGTRSAKEVHSAHITGEEEGTKDGSIRHQPRGGGGVAR